MPGCHREPLTGHRTDQHRHPGAQAATHFSGHAFESLNPLVEPEPWQPGVVVLALHVAGPQPKLDATTGEHLELLDGRRSPQVLIRLLDGPQRLVQLAAEIPGVSRRMLTERLCELEAGGVVTRHVESGPPISVTYALSRGGH